MKILTLDQATKIDHLAVTRLAEYINKYRIRHLVLGISGGLDSAVMAVIGLKAIRLLSDKGYACAPIYDFIGVESDPKDLKKARILASEEDFSLGIYNYTEWYRSSPIRQTAHSVLNNIRVANGNLKCRIRMLHLYDRAQLMNGIVLDTDDLSELLMGFWTKHGDVGDIKVIQQLTKEEVRDLGEFYHITRHILDSAPGDGLGVTDTNRASDQLGMSYLKTDFVMSYLVRMGLNYNGDPSQLENEHIKYYIAELAAAIDEPVEAVTHVAEQSLKTAFKRVYGDDVPSLLPSRFELGLPEVGSENFEEIYLAAIKKSQK